MATCPICRKAEPDPKYKPFCSRRCSDVDLQRWFSGAYAVPGEPLDASPDTSPNTFTGENEKD